MTGELSRGSFVARVPPQDTAYFNRGASHNVGVFATWAMPPGDYSRLALLKKRYDPANLFRLNANVKPAV